MKMRITLIVSCMLMILGGCGSGSKKESAAPKEAVPADKTEQVIVIEDAEESSGDTGDHLNEPADAAEASETGNGSAPSRKDGERFEEVIILEGTEETVKYEHVVNDAIGIEIDYDYESLARRSEAGKESFISIYDDIDNPENYLEITYIPENADAVIATVSEELSKEYKINKETYGLDNAGSCTRIDASASTDGTTMPDQLQMVYIIPAGDGTVKGTAHYSCEAAEGFGHRFAYMMNTLKISVIDAYNVGPL